MKLTEFEIGDIVTRVEKCGTDGSFMGDAFKINDIGERYVSTTFHEGMHKGRNHRFTGDWLHGWELVKKAKGLKLEAGKTYLNRKGEEVEVEPSDKNQTEDGFPFRSVKGDLTDCYTKEGRYFSSRIDRQHDLIEEVPQFKKGDRVLVGHEEKDLYEATFLCYDEESEERFVAREYTVAFVQAYKYCKPFEVKVTHQEIADWKGCDVKYLKVVK